jgi:hypothetical protein
MVNHAFVTDHPEPHPACCPLRRNLAGRVLPPASTFSTRSHRSRSATSRPATAWLRAWPEAPQPARSTPWWRSRSCANERRYRAYTTSIPALALVCSFIKQATANVRSLPMVAAVAHCRATSTRAAGFLKATCLGQPLCVEPGAICEIRSTRDAPPPARAPTWPLNGQ